MGSMKQLVILNFLKNYLVVFIKVTFFNCYR